MNLAHLARLSAAVVSMGVLSSVSQAQVLTADTITGSAPMGYVLNNDEAFSQTFTGAGQLDLVTFRFFLVPTDTSSLGPINVPFALTTWSLGESTGTLVTSGSFSLAAGPSWTSMAPAGGFAYYFDSTFDFGGLVIDSLATYGISLFGSPATDNFIGIGTTDSSGNVLYADGSGFWDNFAINTNLASLTVGNSPLSHDLMFSAIGSAAPVPEASSAAVLFAGMFVGGLMIRRRRRQPAGAGLVASATQA